MTSSKTILIIDDDQAIRNVLQEFLENFGYNIIQAADGLEGMDKIKNQTYDLVIVDIRMPYISGIGLIELIRQKDPYKPIICMTGYGNSPESVATQEQADLTISKPFNLKNLVNEINKLLPLRPEE